MDDDGFCVSIPWRDDPPPSDGEGYMRKIDADYLFVEQNVGIFDVIPKTASRERLLEA
jgi:hypothetical protein